MFVDVERSSSDGFCRFCGGEAAPHRSDLQSLSSSSHLSENKWEKSPVMTPPSVDDTVLNITPSGTPHQLSSPRARDGVHTRARQTILRSCRPPVSVKLPWSLPGLPASTIAAITLPSLSHPPPAATGPRGLSLPLCVCALATAGEDRCCYCGGGGEGTPKRGRPGQEVECPQRLNTANCWFLHHV